MKDRFTFFGNLDVGDLFMEPGKGLCVKVELQEKEHQGKGFKYKVNYRMVDDETREGFLDNFNPVEIA